MYRVVEVADLLGVSKVTVYKKIEELKPNIVSQMKSEGGITFISDEGVNLIKRKIKRRKTRKPKNRERLEIVDLNCKINDLNEQIGLLEKQNDKNAKRLKEELLISDRHLETVIKGKVFELRELEESNNKLREGIERANKLLLLLENCK